MKETIEKTNKDRFTESIEQKLRQSVKRTFTEEVYGVAVEFFPFEHGKNPKMFEGWIKEQSELIADAVSQRGDGFPF